MIGLTINLLVVKVNKCLLEYLKLLSSPVIFPLLTKVSVLSCANLYALDNAITSTICSKSWLLLRFYLWFLLQFHKNNFSIFVSLHILCFTRLVNVMRKCYFTQLD